MAKWARRAPSLALVAAGFAFIQACGGCDEDLIAPITGSVQIQISTTGDTTDANGYTVRVDGGSATPTAVNDTIVVPGLQLGSHIVSLGGLDEVCTVAAGESRTVNVVATETASVRFAVECFGPSGTATVIVTTATAGDTIDPDGYVVSVDADSMAIGVNDTLTFPDIAVGDAGIQAVIALHDVASNCMAADTSARTPTLAPGDTARIAFSITCVAPAGGGTVIVTTSTTGQSLDTNGYGVKVGADSMAIAVNDTVVFSGVPPGANPVVLSGVASNCTLAGAASRTATIAGSDTATVSYQITCQTPANTGSVIVTTVTTGNTLDPDGYRVRIGTDSLAIAVNDTVTFAKVTVGTRSVVLTGIAPNCAVADSARRTALVSAGGTTPVTFPLTCQTPAPTVKDWITFTTNRDGNDEVYLIRPDGSGAANLTMAAAADQDAAWAPDSTRIAFRSTRDGDGEIYIINADGTGLVQVTNNTATEDSPAWSPDGTRLAFVSERDGNSEIYVSNADGTGAVNITNSPGTTEEDPAWSRDGSLIAFTTNRDGNFEIYTMAPDGTGLTNLTNNPAADSWPAWSRDNTRIAFGTERDGNSEIYVMAADGSGATNLTNNSAQDEIPTWSPDGSKIAFRTNRDGNNEIYFISSDGTGVTRVTNNPANDRHPSWGRTAR